MDTSGDFGTAMDIGCDRGAARRLSDDQLGAQGGGLGFGDGVVGAVPAQQDPQALNG